MIGTKITDEEKYILLKTRRNLKFQRKWFTHFPWLAYSQSSDGAFCTFCVIFCPPVIGKSALPPKCLVVEPFKNWKHAIDQFKYHQNLDYHKRATVFAENFIQIQENKTVDISLQLDKQKRAQIELNRKIVSSIIQTLIFIGRQEIACRGHHDSGPITPETPSQNDGNFRALLRFRLASGDVTLQNHFENNKVQYTSPKIQNDIIELCGNIILDKIVSKVHQSQFFCIMADETTDVAGIEQFTLCVRYVDDSDNIAVLREDFLKFVPVIDVTGKGLADTLEMNFKDMKFDFEYLVAQGYDGAATMSGQFKGCAAKILEKYKQAPYIHCCNHSLNLVVSDSCSIPLIRNSLSTINEIINFFRKSAQRQSYLNKAVNEIDCEMTKKRLQKYCETRWIERLDSIIVFKEFFLPIFNALEDIKENGNQKSSEKAFIFHLSMQSGSFIVALVVIQEIFALVHPLSVALQAKSNDLASAIKLTDSLVTLLSEKRENAEEAFNEIFKQATELAIKIETDIQIPRKTAHQAHRDNYDIDSPEDYYRLSIFIPFLDHFITHLNDRFMQHKNLLKKIQNIIPKYIVSLHKNEINVTIDTILDQWPKATEISDTVVKTEALLWQQLCNAMKEKPFTFIDALNKCNKNIFPNIYNIIKICATLPVTVASAERSFSTLKRIKTYLRNSIGENRLNGLATMAIHREIILSPEEVLDKFCEKNRKLLLS